MKIQFPALQMSFDQTVKIAASHSHDTNSLSNPSYFSLPSLPVTHSSLSLSRLDEDPMSRRDARDSDSRRRRSGFDREPSPKRSRRDGKDEKERVARDGKDEKERVPQDGKERVPRKSNLDSAKQTDQDQKQRRRLQDALPLESPLAASDSKEENGASRKESDKKPSGHHEGTKNNSYDPTEVPRSRTFFQHDERGNAGQVARRSGRGSTSERGWWRDSKDQHDDRTVSKTTTNGSRPRNEKSKGDENWVWRHDGYFEMEADQPPARKRPAFREKKIHVESENADQTEEVTAKSSHPDRAMEGSRRKEERSDNPRRLDRSEKQFAGDRVPYRGEAQRGVFPSGERYTGGAGRNHRGRDRFNGRQAYQSSGGRVEKWKHDLYHEANRSPTPKNEEEQIAKVETLLAS